jgi:MFS family permease
MRAFLIIWLGQLVSVIGTRMTGFALGIWLYQDSHSVTQFSLIYLFTYLPGTLISPIAGSIIDHFDRRQVMIISNLGSALSIFIIVALFFWDHLEVWYIYLALTWSSICNIFLFSAYTTTITILVPHKDYGRASGLIQLAQATSQIISPLLAGILVNIIQIQGILLIDCLTFVLALLTLLQVNIPSLKQQRENSINPKNWYQQIKIGWNYIQYRSGLFGLLVFFTIPYFTLGSMETLFTPMVLNFASATELGIILSVGGLGWLTGSLCMSILGEPQSRIYGILGFVLLQGFLLLLGAFQLSIVVVSVGIFGYLFAYPVLLSCSQAIWQNKVQAEFQGRVFGVRYLVEHLPPPIAYLTVAPLADHVFEPLLSKQGRLADSIGQIIGVGPGRGIALMFILIGLTNIITSAIAYQYQPLRQVEKQLPDLTYQIKTTL